MAKGLTNFYRFTVTVHITIIDLDHIPKVMRIVRETTRKENFDAWWSSYAEDICWFSFEIGTPEEAKRYLPELKKRFEQEGLLGSHLFPTEI